MQNPGFEDGASSWTASEEDTQASMSTVMAEAANTGKMGLRVTQPGEQPGGSSFYSEPIEVKPRATYALSFFARCVEESGVGVFLHFFDEHKQLVQLPQGQGVKAIPSNAVDWTSYDVSAAAPENAVTVRVWVHGWSKAKVLADFDGFELKTRETAAAEPRVDAARVRQIAAMLEKTPRGVGEPISNRPAWEKYAQQPGLKAAVLTQAERMLTEPPSVVADEKYLEFSKVGLAKEYSAATERRRFRLNFMVQAEGFENQGRFLPAIEKDIALICSEITWVSPAHDKQLLNYKRQRTEIDLISAMTAWNLATADWLLGDRLKPETRALIRKEAHRRLFAPYLAEARGEAAQEWWSVSLFNWNAVVHAGTIGAALALDESVQERAELIAYAEKNLPLYLKGFKDDGYGEEGLGYWNYGFGHYTLLSEALYNATKGGVNLFADPRMRLVAQFPKALEILPNVYPPIADCLITDRPALWTLHMLDRRYGFGWNIAPEERTITPMYSSVLYAAASNGFPAAQVPVDAAKRPAAESGKDALRNWFAQAQVLIARPAGSASKALGLVVKGGNDGESHGHLDIGTYMVVSGHEMVLLDPGATAYTADTFGPKRNENPIINSYGHPVPVLAGQQLKPGAPYAASVVNTQFTDAKDSVTLDLTKGYASPLLKQFTRQYDYQRSQAGAVTITDKVTFNGEQTYQNPLITLGTYTVAKPGVLLVSRRHETVQVEIDTAGQPYTVTDEVLPQILKSGSYHVRRIAITLDKPVKDALVTLRITAVPPANPDPARVDPLALQKRAPKLDQAIQVKAAEFNKETGGTSRPVAKVASTGGSLAMWKTEGHALTWQFAVPVAGNYAVQIRSCGDTEVDTKFTLDVDATQVPAAAGSFTLPPTSGSSSEANDWTVSWLAQNGSPAILPLTAGSHEITLTNRGGDSSLDWLRLVPMN